MARNSPRGLLIVIAAMALALLASAYGLLQLKATVDTNAETIRQLAGVVAQEQQNAAVQRQLVLALQQQVRDLGGQPLTVPPPTPRTIPRTPATATGPASSVKPSPAPARSSRPTPQPTPTRSSPAPRPSPHASPSPSPSFCPILNVCLPAGGP